MFWPQKILKGLKMVHFHTKIGSKRGQKTYFFKSHSFSIGMPKQVFSAHLELMLTVLAKKKKS